MTQQLINLGNPDKGNGDPIRTAFDKVNDNFTELYTSVIATGVVTTSINPPVSPGAGDLWWDTEDGNLYVYFSGTWTSATAGVQGPQGIQGPAGPAGPVGPRGFKGDTGSQGPQGNIGLTGPQGLKGEKGDKGDTGATGATGAAGAQGEQGPQGLRGLKGDPGDVGPQGPMGPQGPAGPAGPQGLKGDTGATGATGAKGDKGDTGNIGPLGFTGPQGPQGEVGPQGPQGEVGPQGIPGTQVQFSLTAPNPVIEGNVWWNTNDGNLYVHYNNQWVSATSVTAVETYIPTTPSDWNGIPPTTFTAAIDRLAAVVKTLNGGTGA